LRRVRDDAWELDPMLFGSMVHDVLELWGKSACRDSGDRVAIEEFVLGALDRLSTQRYGARPLPAVRLQLQQLERRLSTFAKLQAQEFQAGWRVEFVEHLLADARLEVDGASIRVSGRVDRIDRHEADGRRRILDYKTGEDAHKPLSAHVRAERWFDLQLPLYRHFLEAQLGGQWEAGYFAIPSKLERCGVHIADFKPEHEGQALEQARRVLREMLAGDYARVGSAKPSDRVQRALCGLSLLSLDDSESAEDDDDNEEGA
jgi:ATP-dependent helicase/DNAse subunit B